MGCTIVLPPGLLPSTLVHHAGLPFTIRNLLEDSQASQASGDPTGAFELAQRATALVEAAKDPLSRAAAAIHVSDLYRELGRPGPALDVVQQAEYALQFQAQRGHRHNHAVVSYLFGLLHHELCSYSVALSHYQEACRQFDDARRYWIAAGDVDRARQCEQAIDWIERLCGCLTSPPPLGIEEVYLPIRAESGRYALARATVVRHTLGDQVLVNQGRFQSYSRSGAAMQLDLGSDGEYFALPVPEDGWAGPETEQGDYVLVRRERQPLTEGPGVLYDEAMRDSWLYGHFVRDTAGRVSFRPRRKTIGGTPEPEPAAEMPADAPMGYVVAILKPARESSADNG